MKSRWLSSSDISAIVNIGDMIEYRERQVFSFRPHRWARCVEFARKVNVGSPPRPTSVCIVPTDVNGKEIGPRMSLAEFVGGGGVLRINTTHVEKKKEVFATAKGLVRRMKTYVAEKLQQFRSCLEKNRQNIYSFGTGAGLVGIVMSLTSCSPPVAVVSSTVAVLSLSLLYLHAYHRYRLDAKSRDRTCLPVAKKFTRTPIRTTYTRSKGYKSL
ncbi:hypothetical protein M3Y98_01154900 [Aphelenchoides besseyi]|nr:hypothetical protein M3Y98_01154900 [Aphelenchoides besseyi]KAI6210816.1 hypothetical protein M3Y96_00368200 [Aphelenchoides besseyi]